MLSATRRPSGHQSGNPPVRPLDAVRAHYAAGPDCPLAAGAVASTIRVSRAWRVATAAAHLVVAATALCPGLVAAASATALVSAGVLASPAAVLPAAAVALSALLRRHARVRGEQGVRAVGGPQCGGVRDARRRGGERPGGAQDANSSIHGSVLRFGFTPALSRQSKLFDCKDFAVIEGERGRAS